MKKVFFIVIALVLIPNLVFAQRSIGKVEKKVEKISEFDFKIEQWMGKKFIFLPMDKSAQKRGYTRFYTGKRRDPLALFNSPFTYDKYVNKTLKVIDIGKRNPFDKGLMTVTFKVEETGEEIKSNTKNSQIQNIAFYDDLAKAKERWVGKTIYAKDNFILTYDEESGKYGSVTVLVSSPLKVIDVWWGTESDNPIWIIVETSTGEKGFIRTRFSYTNSYAVSIESDIINYTSHRPWVTKFSESDLKRKYDWSDEIWKSITANKVRIGMTKEQVTLSWSAPSDINQDIYEDTVREQWVYDTQYLYFEGDKLIAIQNR